MDVKEENGNDKSNLLTFRPFTYNSLQKIEDRIRVKEEKGKQVQEASYNEVPLEASDDAESETPDWTLENGLGLPLRMAAAFPPELTNTMIEDLDTFYKNKATFVVVKNDKTILRFNATKSLWLMSPFNLFRRVAISIVTRYSRLLSTIIVITVLANAWFLMQQSSPLIRTLEFIFTSIYTMEAIIRIVAMGFVLGEFTYLRNPWHRLDFIIIIEALFTMCAGNSGPIWIIRALRPFKIMGILPGLSVVTCAMFECAKNLRDILLLWILSMGFFALVGMELYKGDLTQKCIKNFSWESDWNRSTIESAFFKHSSDPNNWLWNPKSQDYVLCGNTTGANCPASYTCLAGFGDNPNYGLTSYDSFGVALLSTSRLFFLHDIWDRLYQQILTASGTWNVLYFIAVIFLGGLFCVHMIVAIVCMSYDELQKKAEEEDLAMQAEVQTMMLEEEQSDKEGSHRHQDNFPLNEAPVATAEISDISPVDASANAKPEESKTGGECNFQLQEDNGGKKFWGKCDYFCLSECCGCWRKFQSVVSTVIFDPLMVYFINVTVVANMIFLTLDCPSVVAIAGKQIFLFANYVFTYIFALEVILKMMAVTPKYFIRRPSYVFDLVVAVLTGLDLVFERVHLPILAVLRLFKLQEVWPMLNLLLKILGKVVGAFYNLVTILGIFLFSFAVLGMHLFSSDYIDNVDLLKNQELPRWNFTDIWHSFMVLFRVLCGQWIESVWDCFTVAGWTCIPYFAAFILIGSIVVHRLFFALLLCSFGESNLSCCTATVGYNKLLAAFERITKFGALLFTGNICTKNRKKFDLEIPSKHELNAVADKPRSQDSVEISMNDECKMAQKDFDNTEFKEGMEGKQCDQDDQLEFIDGARCDVIGAEPSVEDEEEENDGVEDALTKSHDGSEDDLLDDCLPARIYEWFPIFNLKDSRTELPWRTTRLKTLRLIEHNYFEKAVLCTIILSSVALTFEDAYLKNSYNLATVLYHLDWTFTLIFVVEMKLRWIGLGFKKYFTNGWYCFDFVVAILSLINTLSVLCGFNAIQLFQAIRTLRALRPLRVVGRLQGLRVVSTAFFCAIPSISSILLIVVFFWHIFAIVGVQLFGGIFYKCVDHSGNVMNYREVPDQYTCIQSNHTWVNSPMNFDHVGHAYLSLLQVATFRGWTEIIQDATDSRMEDTQPAKEVNFIVNIYFVLFIFVGVFFMLKILTGAIVDCCNEQKKRLGGSLEMFMTGDQKLYYNVMKKIGAKKPLKVGPMPKLSVQATAFGIVKSKHFEVFMMAFVALNMLCIAVDSYRQVHVLRDIVIWLKLTLTLIFTAESVLKIFALRQHYFIVPWNLYDFGVVIVSIFTCFCPDLAANYLLSPDLLRIMRVFRIGRILQFVPGTRGIRVLLSGFVMALPALLNMSLLLFIIMFAYALLGMFLFLEVEVGGGLNDVFNFKTFGSSMLLLFQMFTSAGWDRVLDGLTRGSDDCCKSGLAIAYIVLYLAISYFIVLNKLIAIVLEHYSYIVEEAMESLTDEDIDAFYVTWAKFDPEATCSIPYEQLPDLLDSLDPPLQIEKPNKFKIASMDMSIYKGDMMKCIDILNALAIDFFARKGCQEFYDSLSMDEENCGNLDFISSTLWRQRENFCASVIQRAWRKHRGNQTT